MKTFKQVDKVYIKSNNTVNKIFNRYLYSLIPYFLLIIIYNSIWGESKYILNLFLHTSIILIITYLAEYIIHLIKKEQKNYKQILIDDKILTISLILGSFSINSNIIITILSAIITIIAKNIIKNITISSALYGIFLIIILNYFNHNLETPLINLSKLSYIGSFDNIIKPYGSMLSYLIGSKYYLSPLLSIIVFIYIFSKKSIKYNIVVSYILVVFISMLTFGLINNMNIWYLFFQLTTGNILFLIIFLGTDYPSTPTTGEGQFLYGTILGIITVILRFIIPELSVVSTLIIGPLLLTNIINSISFKLRYHKKYYYITLSIATFILLIANILINIIL